MDISFPTNPLLVLLVISMAGNFFLLLLAIRHQGGLRAKVKNWSQRFSRLEMRLEKAQSILSSYKGIVMCWDDVTPGARSWGKPKIYGAPSAFASLLMMSQQDPATDDNMGAVLMRKIEHLPVHEEGGKGALSTLAQKIDKLTGEGRGFSGAVVTAEGRQIEVLGRLHSGMLVLWLADPAASMAEEQGVVGMVHDKSLDLYGAQSLLESLPVPIWRQDGEGRLLWVNKAFAQLIGKPSPAQAIAVPTPFDSAINELLSRMRDMKRSVQKDFTIVIQGNRQLFRVCQIPLSSAAKAESGGIAFDVTEADMAKKHLEMTRASTAQTLDRIPTAVAVFGPTQMLNYYNHAFQELWGFDDADLLGKITHGDILDMLQQRKLLPEHQEYRTFRARQLSLYDSQNVESSESGQEEELDELWQTPYGKALRVSRLRHNLGSILLIFEDITEKMAMETRYNTLIRVQKSTLNRLGDGVCVFAADGTTRLYNNAMTRLFSPAEDFAEKAGTVNGLIRVIAPLIADDAHMVELLHNKVVSFAAEDRAALADYVMELHDGRYFSLATEPLPDGATLVVFRDITDTKKREKELSERNAILQEADLMKSKFISHISYHLRTPLNSIIGFAEMLDTEINGALNEKQKDHVLSIIDPAYQLLDLTNDIIDLATIEAGKLELQRSDINVYDLLVNAAGFAMIKAEDTQVNLKMNCPEDVGFLHADEGRLRQVLFNLLSNAFSHSRAGSTIILGAQKTGEAMNIFVSDKGEGVSKEKQDRIFKSFEGSRQGVGLGLALVRSIVELHEGRVCLHSEKGVGTMVVCSFPLQEKALASRAAGQLDQGAIAQALPIQGLPD